MFALFGSSPSPRCRHRRHFWVVVTFSRSPCRFASLLLPHSPMIPATTSRTPAAHRRQVCNVCTFRVATLSSLVVTGFLLVRSPLVKSLLSAHLWSNLSMSPLCRHRRHFVVTVGTLSSLSPLYRHRRHFVVTVATLSSPSPLLGCDAFFTFPLPLRVAFASTLTYDPSHNLQDPCSPQEARILMFAPFGSPRCRPHRHFLVTVATLSSPSPLCRHRRHFWVVITSLAISRRFCFHTDL